MTISQAEFQLIAEQFLGELSDGQSSRLTYEGFRAKLSDPDVMVEVNYDARNSFELMVTFSEPGQSDPPFVLADVLRVTACPVVDIAQVELMQTTDVDVLRRLCEKARSLLRNYGRSFVAGDRTVFAKARAVRAARAKELTDKLKNSLALQAADEAWHSGDFQRVYTLLNPISSQLGRRDLRRLEFVTERVLGLGETQ